MKRLALALLALLGCTEGGGSTQPSGGAPDPASTAAAPAAPAAPAVPTAPPAEPAFKLTEDLLTRFLTYRREMLPATNAVMGLAGKAMKASGPDEKKLEQAAQGDERAQQIAAANQAALEKARLTQVEVTQLTSLTTEYYARGYAVQAPKKKLAELKAKAADPKAKKGGMDDVMGPIFEKQVNEWEEYKKTFATKQGQEVADLLEKHADAFYELNAQMMDAMLKKPAN